MKHRTRAPDERVWRITQLSKLSFNHSINRSYSQLAFFNFFKRIILSLFRLFPMRFRFWASDFDPITFSAVQFANRNSLPMRKNRIYCACRDSSKRRDQLLLLWSGAAKRRAECAALLVGPKRPSPRWLSLVWRQRDMPSAQRVRRVNLSWYFVFHNVTDCCCCCCCTSIVYEYVSLERCAPSALPLVSWPEPAPAGCSLTTERRAARRLRVGCKATSLYSCVHPTHRSFCCCLLAVCRG